jgi:uncharacterized protein (TIGR00369 family)
VSDETGPNPSDMLGTLAKGFDSEIGLELQSVTADEVLGKFAIVPKLLQPWGIVHGGVYCSVVESVASFSGQVWLQSKGITDSHVVGVNNSTDFLRAVSTGTMTARSKPIHRGRRQQLWEVDITDEAGKLIAQGRVRLQNIAAEN